MKHIVRLRERLLLVYLVGGLLPMLCMVLFLVGQQRAAVMDLSRSTSYSELSALRNLLAEDSRVLEDVSKRMYFDAQLETIARTQYTDYAQVVAAYRSCTILNEYEDYYSGTISSIRLYKCYFALQKCLLGCAQTPFVLHRADAGCAFVPNTFITKKTA